MSRIQSILLVLGLTGWIGLGLAHVVIVMAGPEGWRPDRSAPGADAVIGHPHDTDPLAVAGPRALMRVAEPDARLLLVLPEATDSADLLYVRYQLAHILYPRRVHVRRATAASELGHVDGRAVLVLAPGVRVPDGCRPSATAGEHRLMECTTP